MTPKSALLDIIRTENDIRNPRRKLKSEYEKIQDLNDTLEKINRSISQSKTMLTKQFDAYKTRLNSPSSKTSVENEQFEAYQKNMKSPSSKTSVENDQFEVCQKKAPSSKTSVENETSTIASLNAINPGCETNTDSLGYVGSVQVI